MTTGQRIKAARKAAGMTQKELGDKLGLSFQSIAQWENDLRNPKYDTLKRIADALDIQVYDLMDDYSSITRDFHNDLLTLEELAAEMNVSEEKILAVLNSEINDPEFRDKMNRAAFKLSMRAESLSKLKEKVISKIGAENYHKFSAALDSALAHTDNDKSDLLLDNLYTAFMRLNLHGQQKAIERVEELTEIPRYRAETAPDAGEGNEPPRTPKEE